MARTLAPGMAAPDLSPTWPVTVARKSWPQSDPARTVSEMVPKMKRLILSLPRANFEHPCVELHYASRILSRLSNRNFWTYHRYETMPRRLIAVRRTQPLNLYREPRGILVKSRRTPMRKGESECHTLLSERKTPATSISTMRTTAPVSRLSLSTDIRSAA